MVEDTPPAVSHTGVVVAPPPTPPRGTEGAEGAAAWGRAAASEEEEEDAELAYDFAQVPRCAAPLDPAHSVVVAVQVSGRGRAGTRRVECC